MRFNHKQEARNREKRYQNGFLFLPKTALTTDGQSQTRWLEWAGWIEVFDSEEEYEVSSQEPHWDVEQWINY